MFDERSAQDAGRRVPGRGSVVPTQRPESGRVLAGDGTGAVTGAGAAVLVDEDDLLDPELWDLAEPTALHADELAGLLPGADLAYLVERGTLADADDHAVVEAVAAWQRLAAWAAAGAARAAAELADRPSMNPTWPASAGAVSHLYVAGEELALRLSCSRMAARCLVRDGRAFLGALASTGDALARGEIDPARARVLVRALDEVPVPLALDVQDAVLPGASGRTATQLARDVARALIVADPGGAHDRHLAAVRRRHVDRPRFLPDGMAGLWAVLPAADAIRLDAGIDGLAQSARTAGDPRTLDQLRADLLVDLTLGRFDAAGQSTGEGPTGRRRARGNAARGTGRRMSLRSQIRVTVPLTSLQGAAHLPGDLAGYGPITAQTAQDLAGDGIWTRIVTDPLSGTVLDVGRTRYRPPAALAEHVRARDRYCARPGCSAQAASCDLDHTIEYGRDHGTTSDDNLGPLCPRDHQIKTDGGFTLSQVEPGVFEWTTPTGHRYRVIPGTDLPVERLDRSQDPPPF